VLRLGLKTKFILAFVGLTLLFAGTFGILAASRLRYTLIEQVRLRGKVVAEEFAREANRFIVTPGTMIYIKTRATAQSRVC